MYSASPFASSKNELPVIPWSSGQTPQAIDALLTFVTAGITPWTVFANPLAIEPLQDGHLAGFQVVRAEPVDHRDHDPLVAADQRLARPRRAASCPIDRQSSVPGIMNARSERDQGPDSRRMGPPV